MSTPYGHAQHDPLAFLDQPIGAFGAVATTEPPSYGLDLGETSASTDSSAQHLQPPAWIQPPRPEVRLAASPTVHVSRHEEWQNGRSRPLWLTCKLFAAGVCLHRLQHAADAAALCVAAATAGGSAARSLAAGRLRHTAAAAALHAAAGTTASQHTAAPLAAGRLHHNATAAALCATAATAGKPTARPLAAGRLQHRRKLARHRAPLRSAAGGRQHGPRLPGRARPPQQQRQNWLQLRPRQPEGQLGPALLVLCRAVALHVAPAVLHGAAVPFPTCKIRSPFPVPHVPSAQLQGALAAVLHEDDSEEGQEAQLTKAAASRMRQHNRSAQRRYREKQRVHAQSTLSAMAAASANTCHSHSSRERACACVDCGHDLRRYIAAGWVNMLTRRCRPSWWSQTKRWRSSPSRSRR